MSRSRDDFSVTTAIYIGAFLVLAVFAMMQFFEVAKESEFQGILDKHGIYQDENGDYKIAPGHEGDAGKGITSHGSSGKIDTGIGQPESPSVNENRHENPQRFRR